MQKFQKQMNNLGDKSESIFKFDVLKNAKS